MTRSNAREVAVHLIYEIDYTGEDPAQAIETRMDRSYYSGLSAENDVYAERPSKKQMDYIHTCVTGVCEHAEELDALIPRIDYTRLALESAPDLPPDEGGDAACHL